MAASQDAIPSGETRQSISPLTVFTLAAGAGLSVASIYYSHPMLPSMGAELRVSVAAIGLVATLTQVGYALGLLFLIPLGDRFDRRRVILAKGLLLALALVLCSLSGSVNTLLLTSLLIGAAATLAQDIVPASAALAPEATRGKTVGSVMTGLLVGILASRVISGFVGEYLGWRVMYGLAAVSIVMITVCLWRVLPRFTPNTSMSYGALLLSMGRLWRRYPALRYAAFAQCLLAVAFSAFWTTLAIMLHDDFGLGSATAGLFGVAGIAGALIAPLAGKQADRFGPHRVTLVGSVIVIVSFASMFLLPLLDTQSRLILIALSALGFDLGVQATLIAHQTLIYSLDAEARGRLNAVFFTTMFVGMAAGSALGAFLLANVGWLGVVALATLAGVGCLLIRLGAGRIPASN